jgi:hypothetical protein
MNHEHHDIAAPQVEWEDYMREQFAGTRAERWIHFIDSDEVQNLWREREEKAWLQHLSHAEGDWSDLDTLMHVAD